MEKLDDSPSRVFVPASSPAVAAQAEARARELLERARHQPERRGYGASAQQASYFRALVSLHELMGRLSQTRDIRSMIRTAVRGAREELDIDRVAVFLREGEFVRGTWGTDERGNLTEEAGFLKRVTEISEHEMILRAFREQDYVAVHEGTDLVLGDQKLGTGWNAMVALWYGGEALGWIAFDNLLSGRALDPLQVEVMKLFAAGVAQALVRSRAEDDLRTLNVELEARVAARTAELHATNAALEAANIELQKLTRIDGLTGIANRRFFDESLRRELGRSARSGLPLAVVMLDVDFFKQYNDSLGHIQGDSALKQVALAAQGCVRRPADLVARYGGEEFVVLLPETDLAGASALAERIRRSVLTLELPHPASKADSVLTVSLGVAALDGHEVIVALACDAAIEANTASDINGCANLDVATALLRSADEALYAAKEAGRNQVVARSFCPQQAADAGKSHERAS